MADRMTGHNLHAQDPVEAGSKLRTEGLGAPGLWSGMAAAMLSGLICWVWLGLGFTASARPPQNSGGPTVSELAQVDEHDITPALTTMDGSPSFLAQFKERKENCPTPLAWVSLVGESGQTPGQVRLQSGAYFSPLFDVRTVPMRVAIPYPGPYEAGQGKLTVLDTSGSVIVALAPAWRVSAGAATREVTWQPRNSCK